LRGYWLGHGLSNHEHIPLGFFIFYFYFISLLFFFCTLLFVNFSIVYLPTRGDICLFCALSGRELLALFPACGKGFLLSRSTSPILIPIKVSMQWETNTSFPGVKRLQSEADH
jgi:hypothetical protein